MRPLPEEDLWQRVRTGDSYGTSCAVRFHRHGAAGGFLQDSDRYSTGWQSEEYEALLEQAAAKTGEQAVHTLARAEQLLLQSGVVLPLYTSMSHYAVSTEVQNAWIDPGEGIIYLKYITKS